MLTSKLDNKIVEIILQETTEGFLVVDEDLNILQAMPGALKLLEIKELSDDLNLIPFLKFFKSGINIKEVARTSLVTARGKDIDVEINSYELDENLTLIKLKPIYDLECAIIKETRKRKSAFIAGLSHDLKTPMQSIMGFSQALLEGITGELPPDQRKYISIIHKNSNKLMRMINNIVDLCKIEAGKLSVNYESFDLREFNSSLEIETMSLIGNKDITFTIVENGIRANEIYTDKDRLEQVILSLIESSIKFTDKGIIKLEYSHPTYETIKKFNGNRFKDAKEDTFLLINICDTGKGLPDCCNSLFEEKNVEKDKVTREYGASGLALVSAHGIIEKLDGKLWLSEDTPEQITISILLPI